MTSEQLELLLEMINVKIDNAKGYATDVSRLYGMGKESELKKELFDTCKKTLRTEGSTACPSDDALVEALREARAVIYDTQQACLFDDDNGQIGVSEDAVISSYHFARLCKTLKRIDATLTTREGA